VPELEFRFDESVAHQDRIEQIIRDLHEEEAKRSAAGSTPLDEARGALSDSRRAEQDPATSDDPAHKNHDDSER
jgi:hypothetical protein